LIDFFGWSTDEYRRVIERKLLRQKVAYMIDDKAKNTSNNIMSTISSKPSIDLKGLAKSYNDLGDESVTYGLSGWVPSNNQDGGLAAEASKLKKDQNSGLVTSTMSDGYYIVRLIDSKASQVNYEYIKIGLTVFSEKLDTVKKENKVSEFIEIVKS
jgi:hypothetical protein